jgi:uncharacterized membrane protein
MAKGLRTKGAERWGATLRTVKASDLLPRRLRGEQHFRWRGGEVSRLETLTDAVFAIALTLLVVSLQVPSTSEQLIGLFWQIPAFALCFAFLVWVWYLHYRYHRRFGFEDPLTVALNGLLLFFVVYYVYPLKFLSQVLVTAPLQGVDPTSLHDLNARVMQIYSAGFVGIFLTLALMYARAWRLRDVIQLDPAERLLTRSTLRGLQLSLAIGLGSLVLSIAVPEQPFWSGIIFVLMGPVHGWNGWRTGVDLERMRESGG